MLKKITPKLIVAGLIFNLLSPHLLFPSQKNITIPVTIAPTVQKMTPQEIDKHIATIKKTVKGLKTINAVTTTLLVGGAVTGVTLSIAIIVGGVALAIIVPGAIAAEGAAAAAPLLAAATSAAGTIGAINAGTFVVPHATAVTATVFGMNATATILAINQSVMLANVTAMSAVAATTAASTATATTIISNVIIGGIVATIVAGSLGALGLTLFGGLDTVTVLTALVETQKLEDMEKAYPGTLTADQKLTLAQFRKTLKGPIARGIAQGLQLKKIKNTLSSQALAQNPSLITTLGGGKKAQKFIETYFDDTKKLASLKLAYESYNSGKQTLQKERDKYKKLDPKHVKLDLKIAGLDIKFALLPPQISALEKKMKKIQQKYQGIEKMLDATTQTFIQESDKIIAELATAK